MRKRASWGSRIGFILAVSGSAVGLGNIWRFPYLVGDSGGAAFIAVYLICLALIGFPVLIAEILIGRTAQAAPSQAFGRLGRGNFWSFLGKMTIFTGFLISSFYSAVAGWILGYLFEAIRGSLVQFSTNAEAIAHFESLVHNPFWCVGFHLLFCAASTAVLYFGVRGGIERGNKIMMPLLFVVLIFLVVRGLLLPDAGQGIEFLFRPDWKVLTPTAFMLALGQAFFTLSLGQGTMVTYGSYLGSKDNLVKSCIPIVLVDTLVAIFAAIAIFSIVFAVGLQPNSGEGLLFHTLPRVFTLLKGGYLLSILFFFLVLLAALTSEISAMEPTIAYLIDEWGWNREKAVAACGLGVFLVGVPSALSFSVLQGYTLYGMNFLGFASFIATSILVPLGGFCAVVLIGWRWGIHPALRQLHQGAEEFFQTHRWLNVYFRYAFCFWVPVLILLIFLHALGIV